jgi:hypothetical protein
MLAKAGQWKEILGLSCDPRHYDDHRKFSDDYLVTTVMQKNPRLPTGIDKAAVALGKFRESETKCAETNSRITDYLEGRLSPLADVRRAVHNARENIRGILGPLTRSKLGFAERNMRFGPGATTSLSGVVTQGKKYSSRVIDATPRVAAFRTFAFPAYWRGSVTDIRLRQSSKLTTVPKNSKTDRVICIEPDLNIFVQLGIGALLRERLRVSGLDLDTQVNNQEAARLAWKQDLCTMDLSAASDTISREVVWLLLDSNWADLLHFARVDYTQVGEEVVKLEKWSSMGNGYTFELESLLFYGVVTGCCEALGLSREDVTVYGDDLIFPNAAQELVLRTLDFLGFSVNSDKTFGKGVFHESCGTDWFKGQNVRPFFLRSDLSDFESVCYLYANSIRLWAHRRNNGMGCDARMLPAWLVCFTAVKPQSRHRIPYGFGDVGFVTDFDLAVPSLINLTSSEQKKLRKRSHERRSRGWSGFMFPYRSIKSIEKRISEQGCLTAFLNGNLSEYTQAIEALRGRYAPPKTRVGHVLEWPNLGPWY